ncbi:MAG: hypothetical protein GX331_09210 [Firmicutes bacterium]|jgi:ABC-type phosphate/phosphonate transport system permease subunit|nr:hypothetical protein [Bacillota bacterium]
MLKKREVNRSLPAEQKKAYFHIMFLAILSLILLLRLAFRGLSNDGTVFHWIIVMASFTVGMFIQDYLVPNSKLSSFAFRGIGLVLFGIALFMKSWAVSTNPLFILSLFFMTVKEHDIIAW